MTSPQADVSSMPTTNRPMNAGMSVADDASRLDAIAKVTGAARYGRDKYLPGVVFASFIRCPWGKAELMSDSRAEVEKLPGVLEVSITRKEANYHGRDVGYICADSPLALHRAMQALRPVWKRSTEIKTLIEDDAGDPPAPDGDAKKLLDAAAYKLDATYTTACQTHSSLESHGCVADHQGESATVWASTQGTFGFRDGLGEALKLDNGQIEVKCEYIGGGFGSKLGGPGKEGLLAARLSQKLRKPVYVFCDRREEHLDTGNRPSSRTLARIAIQRDGGIAGGQIQTYGGIGVGRGGGGCRVPSGRYKLGELSTAHKDVNFNAGGPRAMRAPGHPQGSFAEELMLDEVAFLAKMDPLDLRMRLASSVLQEQMRLGAKLIGWEKRELTGSQRSVIRTGYGMGTCSWGSANSLAEAEVIINRDGSVEARSGAQDIGTGFRTIMAIAAAEAIGVPIGMVRCSVGSSRLPNGPGSGGSVTSPIMAPTMRMAAEDAREKLLAVVAANKKIDLATLRIDNGEILADAKPLMSFKDACALLPADAITGRNAGRKRGEERGHSNGAQFVKCTVDTETGVIRVQHVIAIQSCGKVLCRKTSESQIIGGVIQGLSFGLFEDRLLDRVTGAMVNPNLEWYRVLGSSDMPHIEPILWSKGQTKVCALGEPPVIPTAGALAAAVFNAIGVPVRSTPLSPGKVLAAIASAAGPPVVNPPPDGKPANQKPGGGA